MSSVGVKWNTKVDGIDMVKKQISGMLSVEQMKFQSLGRQLFEINKAKEEKGYAEADYAGENDVSVTGSFVVESKSKYHFTITARGHSLLFIEFGTGIFNEEHPIGSQFGFVHGTYGEGKGANPEGWVYVGEQGTSGRPIPGRDGVYRTTGNAPSHTAYDSWIGIQHDYQSLIKRW